MPVTTSIADNLATRRDRGVAWMNRGHVLQQTGRLPGAIDAYAQAISLLRALPLAGNPSWANSLGAAWMNHGHLLHRAHGITRAKEALASFDQAINRLRLLPVGENPWPRRNLAGSHLNRASLLLALNRPAEARTDAGIALQLTAPFESSDLIEAGLILKARRALCDALGQLLVAPEADQDALATEASDLVDDALTLIRRWQSCGKNPFPDLTLRFFRYGMQLYRCHQPHFLAEFIQENLVFPDPEFHSIAREQINAVLAATPPFLVRGDPRTERHLQTIRELESIRPRLNPTLPTA